MLQISSRLQKVFVITLCWTLLQTATYINTYFLISDLTRLGKLTGSYPFWPDFIGNILLSVFGGLLGGYILVYKANPGFRSQSFLSGIVKSGFYFILIYLLGAICLLFGMAFVFFAINEGIASGFEKAWDNLLFNLSTPSFFIAMMIWAFLVSCTQFMLQVNDKFGQGVLWKFLTGRYYHPREEERIFMFLDLKSSTTIAEQIGHKRFFALLKDLYREITEPVLQSKGEIYQYVGDEVVVTWPVQQGLEKDNCIACFFRVEAALFEHKEYYMGKYGLFPEFKAGLHLVEATVGEIGVIKKDIVYSGDVLNTTSRIRSECNTHGVDLLISSDLLRKLPQTASYVKTSIGEIELRGKAEKIALYTISRPEQG